MEGSDCRLLTGHSVTQWWMHTAVGYQLKTIVNSKQSFLLDLYTFHTNAGFGLRKNCVM